MILARGPVYFIKDVESLFRRADNKDLWLDATERIEQRVRLDPITERNQQCFIMKLSAIILLIFNFLYITGYN